MTSSPSDVLRERLQDVFRSLGDAVRGGEGESEGLLALIKDPAQRAVLDRVTAVMSLVEGHAEYVMDGVGPDVVPTVKTLRKRFAQRRKGRGPLDRVLRHGYYVVPQWFSNTYRVSYRSGKFEQPQVKPQYYQAEDWVVTTWWRKR